MNLASKKKADPVSLVDKMMRLKNYVALALRSHYFCPDNWRYMRELRREEETIFSNFKKPKFWVPNLIMLVAAIIIIV